MERYRCHHRLHLTVLWVETRRPSPYRSLAAFSRRLLVAVNPRRKSPSTPAAKAAASDLAVVAAVPRAEDALSRSFGEMTPVVTIAVVKTAVAVVVTIAVVWKCERSQSREISARPNWK